MLLMLLEHKHAPRCLGYTQLSAAIILSAINASDVGGVKVCPLPVCEGGED